jgi:hypothetical protein
MSGTVRSRTGVWSVALCAALAWAGCGGGQDSEPPVAKPAFDASKTRVPLGSPIEVTYRFAVPSGAPEFTDDHKVFVHFLDANDELMWTDDHDPVVPTSRWRPGETVEYSRTMFIPIYPYVGETTVRLGLYAPQTGRRLPLDGPHNGQRAYDVGRLVLLPQSENVFLIFKEGWHPAEVARDNVAVEWQWTRREATIAFRNPRRDATFYLHLDGRSDLFDQPQRVQVSIGDEVLDTFDVPEREPVLRKVPITSAQFGGADMVDLKLTVDKTFVPATLPAAASNDPRELGVRVFHAFVEPKK